MSKMSTVENIIFEVLRDGEWHSIDEIKEQILNQDPSLLENKNYLNVILNQLKTKKRSIESEGRGNYRKKVIKFEENMLRNQMLNLWQDCYKKSMSKYQPSFDMTEEEFKEGKWVYELNKKIEELIISFQLSENEI